MLHFELNDSGVLAQYSKDLPFDCETLNGCRSKTAPQSLSISRVYSILFLRHNGKLEDGCVVEEGNIVVRAGGDKGGAVDFPLGTKVEARKGSSTQEQQARGKGGRLWARERRSIEAGAG